MELWHFPLLFLKPTMKTIISWYESKGSTVTWHCSQGVTVITLVATLKFNSSDGVALMLAARERERERELFGRICVSAVSSKCLEKNGKVKAPPTWSHHIKYPQWTWGSLKQKQKKSSHFRGRSTENILRVKSVSGPQVHHYTPSLVANVRLWTKGWEGCGEFTGLSRLWMMVDGEKKNQILPHCSGFRETGLLTLM